jgi:hypothetical protein
MPGARRFISKYQWCELDKQHRLEHNDAVLNTLVWRDLRIRSRYWRDVGAQQPNRQFAVGVK